MIKLNGTGCYDPGCMSAWNGTGTELNDGVVG